MDEIAVLVLNYTFEPLHFTNARRAITLLLTGKAQAVEASPRVVRSPSVAFPLPAPLRLPWGPCPAPPPSPPPAAPSRRPSPRSPVSSGTAAATSSSAASPGR